MLIIMKPTIKKKIVILRDMKKQCLPVRESVQNKTKEDI